MIDDRARRTFKEQGYVVALQTMLYFKPAIELTGVAVDPHTTD